MKTPRSEESRRAKAEGPVEGAGEPFLLLGSEGERAFDARALERELRAMWKSSTGTGHGGPFYRAALANLIVAMDLALLDRLAGVFVEVTRRHPARLFRIQREPEPGSFPGRLAARATALCHLRPGSGGFVCCEQILLEWTDATGSLVPSAVRSLLIGDLPVALLAIPGASLPPWHDKVIALADLVITDSAATEEPGQRAEIWSHADRPGAPVHDLAWARLTPWRALITEAFESVGSARAVETVREVTIHFGGASPPAGAWLLAAWMASRLSWRPVSRDRDGAQDQTAERLLFESGNGPVSVRFVRDEEEPSRTLCRVRVRSGRAPALDVMIEHRGREATARVERFAPAPGSFEAAFAYRELAPSLVGELQRQGRNAAYEGAARLARTMMEP